MSLFGGESEVIGLGAHAPDFAGCFEALTGFKPLCWQVRLFCTLRSGQIPPAVDLPTGLGKTSVIPIWLIALAHGVQAFGTENLARQGAPVGDPEPSRNAQNGDWHARLPRRLVYIVNRRTVVDQATDIVVKMRERLLKPDDKGWRTHAGTLHALAETLRRLGSADGNEVPLAVSTLRGELADNEEWRVNPARPAIIIGTIDMVGSKLLFSGYGDGRYGRAHHAGLIGQDALIVHDEAHLTPAFSALLKAIEVEQRREQERGGGSSGAGRLISVMELSATTRSDGLATVSGEGEAFGIEPEDDADSVVQARLSARKRLSLTSAEADGLTERIVQAALAHGGTACRVLVYVRSPEQALEVQNTIVGRLVDEARRAGGRMSREEAQRAAQERVGLLTGTIRGYERDLLAESDLFKAFKADAQRPPQLERTLYLVSTAAGEVGVDLDADHLVCDLTTLDSMIQRFGRVNRLGGAGRSAEISLIVEKPAERADAKADKKSKVPSPLDAAIARTGEILRGIADNGGDVSPAALAKLFEGLSAEDKCAAFSPTPRILPATDILFDAWSLTSVAGEMPGRPQVAEYLHGVAEWELPETFVAWRAEVRQLADAEVDPEMLAEWFGACPILSHERLRDRTDRVRGALDKLLKNRRKTFEDANWDVSVILLNERGEAKLTRLSELTGKPNGRDPLAYATVVLPVEVGGLGESGMLDETAEPHAHLDVAEETPGRAAARGGPRRRERWLCVHDADGERWKHLLSDQETEGPRSHLRERARVTLKEPLEGEEEEEPTEELVLFVEPQAAAESPEYARFRETLDVHHERVAEHLRMIAAALRLPERIQQALGLAARWHDRGKDRPVWQRYAGNYARNRNPDKPLAKSDRYGHPRALGGYRHEFGSLLEAAADPDIQNHPERELILHLIAAHHGWARPHFEQAAQDNEGPVDPATGQRRRPTTRENETVVIEAMQRFGRLQLRFGRWGLAWLESLLRCADALASRAPQTPSVANEAADADSVTAAEEGTPLTSIGGATHDAGSEGPVMSETMSTITVNVDVTNPGQFFACCGLLELADRLWPGAEGRFDLSNSEFALRVAAGDGAAEQLMKKIVNCPIQGLTEHERLELEELERRKRELRKAGRALTEAEEKRRSELGRLTREGHLVLERFQLTLDWWQEDGTPATWAGKQEIHKIARAAQDGIARCMAEGRSLKDMLDWQLVLRTPLEYRSEKGIDKKVEPFYFDARRYAHPLDVGFSLDVQGADTAANPATEFLCLVGLQRFRPQRDGDSKWALQYCAWGPALGVAQAAPAASGLVRVPAMRRLCFSLQFRDDQKRYKAFGFARPMGGS